jgi:hypothetical protein
MAHTPLKMTIDEAQAEVSHAWSHSYSPEAIAAAVDSISEQDLGYRINVLISRLCFRGIYFPQMGKWAWAKVIYQNRRTIYRVIKLGIGTWRNARKSEQVAVAPSLPPAQQDSTGS